MSCTFEIEDAIFKALPNLRIFFAIARNIDPAKVKKEGIEQLLNESWLSAYQQLNSYPNVQSHPNIQLWRQAFQSLKISTKKFSSSAESMAKRASKVGSKPFTINPLVDFYNSFSLKYQLPFGGFDINTAVGSSQKLRFSKEGDQFFALDADSVINIPPGEAVYASGDTVITRHINWKQSKEGLIDTSSADVCFVAEILGGYPQSQLIEMQKEFRDCCEKLLKIEPEMHLLDEKVTSITF